MYVNIEYTSTVSATRRTFSQIVKPRGDFDNWIILRINITFKPLYYSITVTVKQFHKPYCLTEYSATTLCVYHKKNLLCHILLFQNLLSSVWILDRGIIMESSRTRHYIESSRTRHNYSIICWWNKTACRRLNILRFPHVHVFRNLMLSQTRSIHLQLFLAIRITKYLFWDTVCVYV